MISGLKLDSRSINDDIATAEGLTFHVAKRDHPKGAWRLLQDNLTLGDALSMVLNVSGCELAIFVNTPSGGLFYWSSDDPTLLNSVVIRQARAIS